jgi:hypothetical protein
MGYLSVLLIRLARWLSPQACETSLQHMQLKSLSDQTQLERLSLVLSSLLSTAPESFSDMDTSRQLQKALAMQKLATEQAITLQAQQQLCPHRQYAVILKHDGLEWVASYGTESWALIGRGPNPGKALADFDNKWSGINE